MKAKPSRTNVPKRETDATDNPSRRDQKSVWAPPVVITPPYLCPDGKGSLRGSLDSRFEAWKP